MTLHSKYFTRVTLGRSGRANRFVTRRREDVTGMVRVTCDGGNAERVFPSPSANVCVSECTQEGTRDVDFFHSMCATSNPHVNFLLPCCRWIHPSTIFDVVLVPVGGTPVCLHRVCGGRVCQWEDNLLHLGRGDSGVRCRRGRGWRLGRLGGGVC